MGSARGARQVGEVVQGRELSGDLELDADVVVVGSGAGGAVAAATLAEAGHSVVVLEEGPWIPAERYQKMRPSESMRHLWRDGGMSFAVPVGRTPLINVTMGRCVGGSSVLTGGVCFRIPGEVHAQWVGERGLSQLSEEALAPFFEAVEARCHVEEVPAHMRSRGTELFGEGCRALGLAFEPLRRNTKGCNGCGQCNFGCPHGAKQSVDRSYLPGALAAGTTLVADCLVERVTTRGWRASGVVGRLLDARRRRRGRVRVHARAVVVACGAWHGPLLLQASGVGRRHGQVGRHLSLHPAFRMLGRFDEPVRGWSGALQSAYSPALMHEGMTMVGLWVPPGVLAATMPGFGPHHLERARQIPNLAMFGGLIHDEGGGVVRRGLGREPIVTYRMARADRALIPRLVRTMAEVFIAAGAKEVFLPILGHEPVTPDNLRQMDLERLPAHRFESASQHPLGSCRMGTDPSHSVVDDSGETWDCDGLYVADGSVMPSSLGVNPQLSVMAMSLRIARRISGRLARTAPLRGYTADPGSRPTRGARSPG